MKKTIFTFCSIAIVCCAIFFACAKDDNSITHVTYAVQSSAGTGGNPNPNGLPSNSGYGTTTSTTAGTTTSSNVPTVTGFTVSGTASQNTGGGQTPGSGIYDVTINSSNVGKIDLDFNAKPVAGTYSITGNMPIPNNQCEFGYMPNSSTSASPNSGVVTVAVSGGVTTVYFSNLVCYDGATPPNTYTVSGSTHF